MKMLRLFGRKKNPQGAFTDKCTSAKKTRMNYASRFLERHELKNRQSVYISDDTHKTVRGLVRTFANHGKETTISGFIDTVLTEHFKEYRQEINESLQDAGSPL